MVHHHGRDEEPAQGHGKHQRAGGAQSTKLPGNPANCEQCHSGDNPRDEDPSRHELDGTGGTADKAKGRVRRVEHREGPRAQKGGPAVVPKEASVVSDDAEREGRLTEARGLGMTAQEEIRYDSYGSTCRQRDEPACDEGSTASFLRVGKSEGAEDRGGREEEEGVGVGVDGEGRQRRAREGKSRLRSCAVRCTRTQPAMARVRAACLGG